MAINAYISACVGAILVATIAVPAVGADEEMTDAEAFMAHREAAMPHLIELQPSLAEVGADLTAESVARVREQTAAMVEAMDAAEVRECFADHAEDWRLAAMLDVRSWEYMLNLNMDGAILAEAATVLWDEVLEAGPEVYVACGGQTD